MPRLVRKTTRTRTYVRKVESLLSNHSLKKCIDAVVYFDI